MVTRGRTLGRSKAMLKYDIRNRMDQPIRYWADGGRESPGDFLPSVVAAHVVPNLILSSDRPQLGVSPPTEVRSR